MPSDSGDNEIIRSPTRDNVFITRECLGSAENSG